MTRQDYLYKWFWYAMALLPVWLLEFLIFPSLPVSVIRPVLLPVAVAAAALLEGPRAGAWYGLTAGLLFYASLPGEGVWLVPLLALGGFLVGTASLAGLTPGFPGCLLCSAGILALLDLMRLFSRLSEEGTGLIPLLRVAGSELCVSLLFVAPIYLLYRKVYDRVGGTKLA